MGYDPIDDVNFFKGGMNPELGGRCIYNFYNGGTPFGAGGAQQMFTGMNIFRGINYPAFFTNNNGNYINTCFYENNYNQNGYGDMFMKRSYTPYNGGFMMNNSSVSLGNGQYMFGNSFLGYGATQLSMSGVMNNKNILYGPIYTVDDVSDDSKGYKYGITAGGSAKFYNPDGEEITMEEFKKAVGSDFGKFKDAINAECRHRRFNDAV